MHKLFETGFILLVIVAVIAIAILAPVGLIWALNQLFGLNIVYSAKNIFAAFILVFLFARPSIATGGDQ